MSYYMDLAGEVNDSPQEDDFAHYPAWGSTVRAHRYSSEYEADQWFATREAPKKPHLLKTEKEAHEEGVAFVLNSREAARSKKAFPGAIPAAQSASVNQPEAKPAKPAEKKPAAPVQAPEPDALPAPVRGPAQVMEAPARRDQSGFFGDGPDGEDYDGGVFDSGFSAAEDGGLFASLAWQDVGSVSFYGVEHEGRQKLPSQVMGVDTSEEPDPDDPSHEAWLDAAIAQAKENQKRLPKVAIDLIAEEDANSGRWVCWVAKASHLACLAGDRDAAIRGALEEAGRKLEGACARVWLAAKEEYIFWTESEGQLFRDEPKPVAKPKPGNHPAFFPLLGAAKRGDFGGVRGALAEGVAEDEEAMRFALEEALQANQALVAIHLLDHGAKLADPDFQLSLAASAGRVQAARLLIERGADPKSLGPSAAANLITRLLVESNPFAAPVREAVPCS